MNETADFIAARIAKAIKSGEADHLVKERAAELGMQMGRCCHGRLLDAPCARCDKMTAEFQS